MQISAANLLSTQGQALLRPRADAAAFEPLAFQQTPMTRAAQGAPKPAESGTTARAAGASAGTGYVRPGTHIDVKV